MVPFDIRLLHEVRVVLLSRILIIRRLSHAHHVGEPQGESNQALHKSIV